MSNLSTLEVLRLLIELSHDNTMHLVGLVVGLVCITI